MPDPISVKADTDKVLPERVVIALGLRSYDILIGRGVLAEAGKYLLPLVKRPRVFIVTDTNVDALYGKTLQTSLRASGFTVHWKTLPAGEQTKNWDMLGALIDWLLGEGANRDDVLIAFGGGVIGDITGLAASLLKRGLQFVQMPTSLLAQVDSSVGGKTAVNTARGKNLIGTFYQPRLVLSDTQILATLPVREKRAGYAEIVKYGLIDRPEFFSWLETHGETLIASQPDDETLAEAIRVSCQAKAAIVAQDEREGGVRALLNLGHTFGHALEATSGYGPDLLHGEAVAAGMVLALFYSARIGMIERFEAQRVRALLMKGGLETDLTRLAGGPYHAAALIEAMRQDKKVRGGRVPLILARGIGKAFIHPNADLADVGAFLDEQIKGV